MKGLRVHVVSPGLSSYRPCLTRSSFLTLQRPWVTQGVHGEKPQERGQGIPRVEPRNRVRLSRVRDAEATQEGDS